MKVLVVIFTLTLCLSANAQKITLVKDINPGPGGSDPSQFTVFNNKLYFSADDGKIGRELYGYDGTNTALVCDLNPGKAPGMVINGINAQMAVLAGNLYFAGDNGKTGGELYKYDGIHKPILAADIVPGPNSSWPAHLIPYKDKLYFFTVNDFSNDIFSFDGKDLFSVSKNNILRQHFTTSDLNYSLYKPYRIDLFNNLLFYIHQGVPPNSLLNSVPADERARLITEYANEYYVGAIGLSGCLLTGKQEPLKSVPYGFVTVNNTNYFCTRNGANTSSQLLIYRGDATPNGPFFEALPNFPSNMVISATGALGNDIVFYGSLNGGNIQMFKYDLIKKSVSQLFSLSDGYPASLSLITYHDKLYYTASDTKHGTELWVYDGKSTNMVMDLNPGTGDSNPTNLFVWNGALFMNATNGKTGDELYVLKD